MTSELKPCPFCGGRAERIEITEDDGFENRGGAAIECQKCFASSHVEFGRVENLVSVWNTRAVPDAPELVRLTLIDHYGGNSEMVPVGSVEAMYPEEYVLYDQAAEIIAAKQYAYDVEYNSLVDRHNQAVQQIEKWIDTCSELEQRAEAAEAKLAQYEAQEPAMWLCTHDDRGSDRAITTSFPSRKDILKADGYEITPLYTSPLAPEGGKP